MNQVKNNPVTQEQINHYMMTFGDLFDKVKTGNFKMPVFWNDSWKLVKDECHTFEVNGVSYHSYEFEIQLDISEYRGYSLVLSFENLVSSCLKFTTNISGYKIDSDYSLPKAELFGEGYLEDDFLMEAIFKNLEYLEAEFMEEIERQRAAIEKMGEIIKFVKNTGKEVSSIKWVTYTSSEFKAATESGSISQVKKVWSIATPDSDELNDYYLSPQEALVMAAHYEKEGYDSVYIFQPNVPFLD